MFGNKNANFMDALLHQHKQSREETLRSTKDLTTIDPETPIDVLVRKETYFAMSRTPRWNQ